MNKKVVLTAIAERMEHIYKKKLGSKKNLDENLEDCASEIEDLYHAYMELEGASDTVFFTVGESEAARVEEIYRNICKEKEKRSKELKLWF